MTKIDVSTLYRRKLFVFPNFLSSRLSSIQIFNNSQSDSHLRATLPSSSPRGKDHRAQHSSNRPAVHAEYSSLRRPSNHFVFDDIKRVADFTESLSSICDEYSSPRKDSVSLDQSRRSIPTNQVSLVLETIHRTRDTGLFLGAVFQRVPSSWTCDGGIGPRRGWHVLPGPTLER